MVGVCGAPAEVNDARHELLSLPISDNTYTASEKRKKRKKQSARLRKSGTLSYAKNIYCCRTREFVFVHGALTLCSLCYREQFKVNATSNDSSSKQ